MKKVFKFFAIVILLVIAFGFGVLYKENEQIDKNSKDEIINAEIVDNAEDINSLNVNYYDYIKTFSFANDNTDVELEFYQTASTWFNPNIQKDLLDSVKTMKNKEYEIEISDKPLTQDEIIEKILPTYVSIKWGCTLDGERYNSFINGNIYDITNDYIYIITCSHMFDTQFYYGLSYDKTNNIEITFIDGTNITVQEDCFYYLENNDLGLIKINKSLLSNDTLNIIKSINIENMYLIPLENNATLYNIHYNASNKVFTNHIFNYEKVLTYNGTKELCGNSDLTNGCSGGGMFDSYGNYFGFCENSYYIRYFQIFPDFEELLRQSSYY